MRRERLHEMREKSMLVLRFDMLENVEGVGGVIAAADGAGEHIVHEGLEFPPGIHPVLDVLDEHRVEIGRRKLLDFLSNDARAKSISTANLEDVLAAGQKPGNKLVARQSESQPLR